MHFYIFLLKDVIVIREVTGLIFHNLACSVFSFLALVLIIKAFLAYILKTAALTVFLFTIYKRVFFITIIGAILVLKPIYSLSLTSLGVALYLYFNSFSLYLRHLFLLSFIFNWTFKSDFIVK